MLAAIYQAIASSAGKLGMLKNKWIKLLLWLVVGLVGFLAIALVGLYLLLMSVDLCANEIHQEIYSPERTVKAVIFQRDCGATTGFSTHVSIVPAEEVLGNDGAGNLYIANGHPAESSLVLQWSSETSIIISGSTQDAIKQENRVEGVKVSYH
jgi:hypothetical protein